MTFFACNKDLNAKEMQADIHKDIFLMLFLSGEFNDLEIERFVEGLV